MNEYIVAYVVDKYSRIAGINDPPDSPYPFFVPDDADVHYVCDVMNEAYNEGRQSVLAGAKCPKT